MPHTAYRGVEVHDIAVSLPNRVFIQMMISLRMMRDICRGHYINMLVKRKCDMYSFLSIFECSSILLEITSEMTSTTSSMQREQVFVFSFLSHLAEVIEEEVLEEDTAIPIQTEDIAEVQDAEDQLWKEENLMTERDLEITSYDLPERMQLVEGI